MQPADLPCMLGRPDTRFTGPTAHSTVYSVCEDAASRLITPVSRPIHATRLVFAVLVMAISAAASAQDMTRPLQLGGEYSALGLYRESDQGIGISGLGIRANYRLTRRVDIEGRALWFPMNSLQEFEAQGGHTTQLALGLRGKFLMRKRVSFYGVLLPELLHFSNTIVELRGPDAVTGGSTHFALDWGIGAEIKASDRWSVHFDATGPLYAIREVELYRSEPGPNGAVASASLAARMVNVWQMSGGLTCALGSTRKGDGVEQPVEGAWELGGQFARTTSTGAAGSRLQTLSSLGAFASYRLLPAIYADAAVNFATDDNRYRSPWDGGYVTQALAGVKVGVRKDAYGIFGKVRVGVNSHSGAVRAFDARGFTLSRANALVVDGGAVLERYLGRRWVVRFDAGDTISMYRSTTSTRAGVVIPQVAPPATDSLQMTIGVGWRFN